MMFEKPLRVQSYEVENTTQRLLIRVIDDHKNLYNLNKGDMLIARGKDRHIYYSTSGFYVYDLETAKLLGGYSVCYFEILGVFENLEDLQQHVFGNNGQSFVTQQEETSITEKIEEKEYGQMNLFDF